MSHIHATHWSLCPAYKLKGHQSAVLCCASAGSRVASGAEDGTLLLHDLRNAPCAFGAFSTASHTSCNAALKGVGQVATATPTAKPLCSILLKGHDGQSAAVMAVASNPLSPEHSIFAAAGSVVHHVDLRAASVVQTYTSSKDEVNGLCLNGRGTHLATGDDGGEAQVYDLTAGRLFKSIRNVHSSICSSVAFRAHNQWDLLTGGLDCTLAKYDFSRPKCVDRWDMNALTSSAGQAGGGGGQIFNPPFVHQVAVPHGDARPGCHWVAAARGDGAVVVLDADVSSVTSGASGQVATAGSGARGRVGGRGKSSGAAARGKRGAPMQPLVLDRDAGGHTMPVCSVAFAPCSSSSSILSAGQAVGGAAATTDEAVEAKVPTGVSRLYSAGEDCRIILWDVAGALEARASGVPLAIPLAGRSGKSDAGDGVTLLSARRDKPVDGEIGASECQGSTKEEGEEAKGVGEAEGRTAVLAEVRYGRKVNQLCCLELDGQELIAVAAVSKFVVVYRTQVEL